MRVLAVLLAALITAAIATPAPAATETDYFTFLKAGSAYPGARGDSDYEREGTRREVDVTVTGIRRLAGQRITVHVAGRRVGTMLVSSRGRAHRDWSTSHGSAVPSAHAGSRVVVRTAGGTLVVSGSYRVDRGD